MLHFEIEKGTELRLLHPIHAVELFQLVDGNRPYLRRWLPWLEASENVTETVEFIQRSREQFENRNGFATGIWFEGRLAGVVGCHGIDWVNRKTSIGYWLGAEFQGKGLATKACRVLVGYAFRELELNRVEILCATGNRKSRAIPERLGFRQEGTLREVQWLYDHFEDLVVYGMLRREWESGSVKKHAQ